MKMIFLTLILATTNAFANGWVSTGGELVKDSRNPWFVKNTTEVAWCLQVDTNAVSVKDDVIETAFNDALTFWKQEFDRAQILRGEGSFTLGDQKFVKKACSDPTIDIRVIFGSSLLTQEEKTFLVDPDKYVGVTVRTTYDPVNLKGKGFIFFSADMKQGNTPLFDRAWQKPKILRYALKHELGHVFGMPHVGSGLMSEIFLDQIMKPEYISIFEKANAESFLSPNLTFKECGFISTSATRQFFGFPTNHDCILLEQQAGINLKLKVSSQISDEPNSVTELGTLQMDLPDFQDYGGKPVSFMHLTEEQVVFTPKERAFRLFLVGPLAQEFGSKGSFIPKVLAPPKSVYMKVTPQGLNIIGNLVSGKIAPVLQYNSPLSLIYVIKPGP